jgi:hypothetical protein
MKYSLKSYIPLFVVLLLLFGLYLVFNKNKKETMYEKNIGELCTNDTDCNSRSCGKLLYTDHTKHCKNSS